LNKSVYDEDDEKLKNPYFKPPIPGNKTPNVVISIPMFSDQNMI